MQNLPIQRVRTNNDQFQILQALKENRRKRSELGEVFIEGIEAIKQALAAGWPVRKVLCADYQALSNWARQTIAGLTGPEILQLENGLYKELSDKDEPSELMMTVELRRPSLENLSLAAAPLVVIFDRPSDHGNLGSVIRSANAFGADAVIIVGHGVDPFEPKVIRSSLGAVFHTPVAAVESLANLEAWLTAARRQYSGFRVIGTDSGGSEDCRAAGLRRPCAIILGNEAKGMSVALQQMADAMVRIPIGGQVNSLNVACAASILLWQANQIL